MRRSVEHLILVALAMSMVGCQGAPLVEQAAQKSSNTPTVASPDNRTGLSTLGATSGILTPVFTETTLGATTPTAAQKEEQANLPKATVQSQGSTTEPTKEDTSKIELEVKAENVLTMQRVKDFYSSVMDYRGPNNQYMYVDSGDGKTIVELDTYRDAGNGEYKGQRREMDGHGAVAVHKTDAMSVLLGIVRDDVREYCVYGSISKSSQKLAWAAVAGYLDANAYPHISWVDINENKYKPAQFSGYQLIRSRSNLDTLYDWLKPSLGKPVEIMVFLSVEVIGGGAPICGGNNPAECDFIYNQIGTKSGENLYKWWMGQNIDPNSLPFAIRPDENDFSKLVDLKDVVWVHDIRIPSQRTN